MFRNDARTTHQAAGNGQLEQLPAVDVGSFATGDPESRLAVAQAIGAACETIGFMYVTGHGVPSRIIESAQEAAREFFASSRARKQAVARRRGTYRGYVPIMPFSEDRDTGERYLYEAFLLGPELEPGESPGTGMRWPNRWPPDSGTFRRALTAYHRALDRLSGHLLEAFALALGQPEDALRRRFERPMTNISLLHYPATPAGAGRHAANARPHHDTNALTILLPGDVGGLQVAHRALGWTEVPPRPGSFVVNIGTMMEAWSGGRFRSTLHRVHPPVGRARHAIGYFASPDYDTLVEPLPGIPAPDAGGSREPLHAGRAFEAFVAGFDPPPPPAGV